MRSMMQLSIVGDRIGEHKVKLRLQHDKCTGHAQCHAVDPVAFPIDDDGYSVVTERPVAADEEQVVRDGVAACPELALLLEE